MRLALLALFLTVPAMAAEKLEFTTGPVKMKPSEIRAYNAHLPKDHPNFIRCKRESETGSLAKRVSTCRTNEEWARVETQGNNNARDAVEGLQKGWSRGS